MTRNTILNGRGVELETRWKELCRRFLPLRGDGDFWRFSRGSYPGEPLQGWKLHVSATILSAAEVLERIGPYLRAIDVQFKAPRTLHDLADINCGLRYGYPQIGKFVTVYPASESEAVRIAAELDRLTAELPSVSVPFDEQYAPGSSVYYRYGAFRFRESVADDGSVLPVITDPDGKPVHDDRTMAVPGWAANPFPDADGDRAGGDFRTSPLSTRFRVFKALSQRGKGGTYLAVDLSDPEPGLCVIKEGRRNGEVDWNGLDGADLIRNEASNLLQMSGVTRLHPTLIESFACGDNVYLVLEHIAGQSLQSMLNRRRRRLSIRRIIELAFEINAILGELHRAGWVWGDCKPANLIVTASGKLRPIDFEAAYRIGGAPRFDWRSDGFSSPKARHGVGDDLFALGAVLYFLATGVLYDGRNSVVGRRRRIPAGLLGLIRDLLAGRLVTAGEVDDALELINEARHIPSATETADPA